MLAGERELDIDAFGSRTLIDAGHIRDEHAWEGRQFASVAAGELRVDAVHVELAVADVVEPRPRHDCMATLHALGNGEVELVHAVDAIGLRIRAVEGAGVSARRTGVRAVEVQQAVCRTPTLDAVDDVPVLRILDFRRIGLVGDADLAGAAAMDGCVETVARVECEELVRACCHFLAAGGWE